MLRLAKLHLCAAVLTLAACNAPDTPSRPLAEAPAQAPAAVFHVVAFRFKTDDATRAQIPAVVQAFAALRNDSVAADGSGRRLILSFHAGANDSKEQLSFGPKGQAGDRTTEETFILTFASVEDRDYYVDLEPHHQAFKQLAGPLLEGGADGVFVTDFAE